MVELTVPRDHGETVVKASYQWFGGLCDFFPRLCPLCFLTTLHDVSYTFLGAFVLRRDGRAVRSGGHGVARAFA